MSLFSLLMNQGMEALMLAVMQARQMLNSSRLTDMREVRSGCVYLDSSPAPVLTTERKERVRIPAGSAGTAGMSLS